MSLLDKRTAGDLTKLVVFMVVTALATGLLVVIIGNLSFGPTREYKAVFVDATGVVEGSGRRRRSVRKTNPSAVGSDRVRIAPRTARRTAARRSA